jgi:hypothetical protein
MNEPRRLIAGVQSPLASELLRAAQSEQIPDELSHRMAQGLALALGTTTLGATVGATLGTGAALTSQAPGAAALGAQQALGSALSAATGTLGAASATQTGAWTLGSAWASGAVWVKGGVTLMALAGLAGVGSWLGSESGPSASNKTTDPPPQAITVAAPPNKTVAAPPNKTVAPPANEVEESVAPSELDVGDMQVARESLEADAPATRLKQVRPKGKVIRGSATEKSGAELSGDLGREVQMLDAARRAIIAGNLDSAREKLAQYSRAFPNGSLRAEAASLAKAAGSAQ